MAHPTFLSGFSDKIAHLSDLDKLNLIDWLQDSLQDDELREELEGGIESALDTELNSERLGSIIRPRAYISNKAQWAEWREWRNARINYALRALTLGVAA